MLIEKKLLNYFEFWLYFTFFFLKIEIWNFFKNEAFIPFWLVLLMILGQFIKIYQPIAFHTNTSIIFFWLMCMYKNVGFYLFWSSKLCFQLIHRTYLKLAMARSTGNSWLAQREHILLILSSRL